MMDIHINFGYPARGEGAKLSIYIALLRGINVSGQKLIKMAELKRVFEVMGLRRVQTFIQSGNVLFESEEEGDTLRRRIERELETAFGYPVPTVVRNAADFERIVGNCPFDPHALAEGENVYVAFLAEAPTQEGINRLLACPSDTDECRLAGQEAYLLIRQGMAKTMFANNFLEKKLGVAATTRNWQTTTKLLEMAKAMDND